jgi:DNA-3-methyladenine glycosylase I
MTRRCPWAANGDATMQAYHDLEWGVPLHGDNALFELLTLEGAQAGLSWRTVLARREGYRTAFHAFDIDRVAAMTDADLEHRLTTAAIIRNRQKVFSVRDNARAVLEIAAASGSFDAWLWSFVDGTPIVNRWDEPAQVPATTPLSDRLSKALRQHGFRFVGSTICYAFLQASGMVNDHLTSCFRHGHS